MSFKNNIGDSFLPSIDPFGGRGDEGGLNHGGQYDVEYIVENLNKGTKRPQATARPTANRAVRRKSAKAGQRPFMRSTPPVAAPKPTKSEMARMKSATGVDDVSVDNEDFVNVSGAKKKEIERGLADYTCWRVWDGGGQNCASHARWELQQGRCQSPVVSVAKQRLEACTRAQGNPDDVAKCTKGRVNYSDSALSDKKGRRLHVQGTAKNWLADLESEVDACLLKQQMGAGGNGGGGGGQTIYGCMDSDALNYNPSATYNRGCEYADESENADGSFDDTSGDINAKLDELFTRLGSLELGGAPSVGAPSGGMPTPANSYAYDYDYAQSSVGGSSMNPLLIGGLVLVVGLAVFMINKPQKAAVPVARPIA